MTRVERVVRSLSSAQRYAVRTVNPQGQLTTGQAGTVTALYRMGVVAGNGGTSAGPLTLTGLGRDVLAALGGRA